MTPSQWIALFIIVLLFIGILARRTMWHPWIQGTAIALNLGLVLFLEATRHVIEKNQGSELVHSHWLFGVHITTAVLALVLQIVLAVTGLRLIRDSLVFTRAGRKRTHGYLGYTMIVSLVISFATSPGFFIDRMIGR